MSKYDYNSETPFSAFITNLAAYNDGELKGEWVEFPTTREEYNAVLERIGIDEEHEEFFISDYDNYTDLPINDFGEYENVDQLNYLASKIEDMSEGDYKIFCAAVEADGTSDAKEIINIAENVENGNIFLREDISSEKDLGIACVQDGLISDDTLKSYVDTKEIGEDIIRYDMEETEELDPTEIGKEAVENMSAEELEPYIDYESLGRDISMCETSEFTSEGYLTVDTMEDLYDGEVPNDMKVTGGDEEDVDAGIETDEDPVE